MTPRFCNILPCASNMFYTFGTNTLIKRYISNLYNRRAIYTVGRLPAKLTSRRYMNTQSADTEDVGPVAQGPKDTLLMLGYSIKEDEMEKHVHALKETVKLKLMTLSYYTPDMAQSFTDLAMAQHQSVQFINESKENYMKALDIWTKLKGPQSREVANMLCLIGVVLRDLGDLTAAKSAFKDSIEIDNKIGTTESQLSSVLALNNLAGIEHLSGNAAEAADIYEDAVRIILTATGGDPNHRMIALLYYNLACCHNYLGDKVATEISLTRAREIIATIGDTQRIGDRIQYMLDELWSEKEKV
ncbi:TPR repeat family protein [Babesia bovis T2Bo]|uniref:TPR repeat family protein n=1 Tax=Babesia bovis T2Bo TaxID=484906 RepID=UPI001D943340|nr:TPR repeat family protein [Babesia bovis T2Bo]EDO07272.2 TPR repeat family protein [Babesia bovis T2Bo]